MEMCNQNRGGAGSEGYSKEIPHEIKRAIKGIDHDIRYAIMVALNKYKKLAFTELREKIDISQGRLNHHLGIMKEGGLVESFLGKRDDYFSFYQLSSFGLNFLSTLMRLWHVPKSESDEVYARQQFLQPGFNYSNQDVGTPVKSYHINEEGTAFPEDLRFNVGKEKSEDGLVASNTDMYVF